MSKPADDGLKKLEGEGLSYPAREALVECDTFTCLGVQMPDGSWVDMRGKPLQVVRVIYWFRPPPPANTP